MNRREFVSSSMAALGSLSVASASPWRTSATREILIQPDRPTGAFPHYWQACAGSGHAALALRAEWQSDLELAHRQAGIQAVRFHGVLDDDLAVCTGIDSSGPRTNFVFVDQIYDRMLEIGVRPYVELSFMPGPLASSANTVFWYRGNTSPPRRMSDWQRLIAAFAHHLVERYGLEEVAQWRFECWNEPNLSFWSGSKQQYFELYRHTAAALKGVSPRLQVGGPATAMTMWIADFLADCATHGTSVDFVSSHIYPDDPQENIFGRAHEYPYDQVMPRALEQANRQIRASSYPHVPLVISEWASTDPAFIAQMIRDCAGLTDTMSYWTFCNVFEEHGPNRSFMNDTYGMIGTRGVPRPTLQTFRLLRRLGEQRLQAGAGPVLATRRSDGSLATVAWHLQAERHRDAGAGNPVAAPRGERPAGGPMLPLSLKFDGVATTTAQVTVVDPARDPVAQAYAAMGAPPYPTVAQIRALREAGARQITHRVPVEDGRLELALAPSSVALIELG